MPLFTIITAVKNSFKTIGSCIDSIQNQTCKDFEHMIIDGASTDGTLELINGMKIDNTHILSKHDNGVYDAMNKGISLASGDVLGFLNSDDFYANKNVLSIVAKAFEETLNDSCYGDLEYVDFNNTGRIVRRWKSGTFQKSRFFWGWMPPHPTFFVHRSIYKKYGYFDLSLGSAADYELMLRFLLKHQITTTYIPEVLVKMRMGGISNLSLKNRLKANRMDRKAWEVNGLKPYPWTTFLKPVRKIGQFFFHQNS